MLSAVHSQNQKTICTFLLWIAEMIAWYMNWYEKGIFQNPSMINLLFKTQWNLPWERWIVFYQHVFPSPNQLENTPRVELESSCMPPVCFHSTSRRRCLVHCAGAERDKRVFWENDISMKPRNGIRRDAHLYFKICFREQSDFVINII